MKIIKNILISLMVFGMFGTTTFAVNSTSPTDTQITTVNGAGSITVNPDTILVGTTDKATSIIDLFSQLSVDGVSTDNYMDVLDVRFVTPENQDFKVDSDTTIISENSKIYVLFKSQDNGGLVSSNNKIDFQTKNLKLEEIGTISDTAENSYNLIYKVVDQTEPVEENTVIVEETTTPVEETVEPIEDIEEEIVINNTVLEENNTGIKENLGLLTILIIGLLVALKLPLYSKND